MPNQIKIILVDDHKIVRESWSLLLNQVPGFSIVGECANGMEAIEDAQKLLPDVMLIDINMPFYNGFETARIISQKTPTVKIIGISINDLPNYALKMIKSGAKGFVTKSSPLHEVVAAIKEVYGGHQYICQEIKNQMN